MVSVIGSGNVICEIPCAEFVSGSSLKCCHVTGVIKVIDAGSDGFQVGDRGGLELLPAVAVHRERDVEVTGLDSRTLRFVIEYPAEVDVAATAEEIRSVIGIDDFQFFRLLAEPSTDLELGEFYALQFPGLERTLDSRSLFSIAHELQARLGAITVEPDLGSEFYQEPVPPDAMPEGLLGDVFRGLCFVAGDPPADSC